MMGSIKIHEPDLTDEHGYPTDALEAKVAEWPIVDYSDCEALLEFVHQFWWHPEYMRRGKRRFREFKGGRLTRQWLVNTVGWSGNEQLINALERNAMFMALCWWKSERGGHYEYRT